jgi:uncharacterized membrane protein (UPF0127 family)
VRGLLAAAAGSAATLLLSCTPGAYRAAPSVAFDSTSIWILHGADSTALSVEVADSEREYEVGLSGRAALTSGWGMLFAFDSVRSGDDGFWMVGTRMPLDIAFIDERGVISRILSMEVCDQPRPDEDCPGYFPRVPYAAALEVGRGWFAAHGIEAGARVRVGT